MPNSENYDDRRNNYRADLNLLKELNEILSIENAAAVRIASRIDNTPIEGLREVLKRHLDVTNSQKSRLQNIIRQFGGRPTDANADLLSSFVSSSTASGTKKSENDLPENLEIEEQNRMIKQSLPEDYEI